MIRSSLLLLGLLVSLTFLDGCGSSTGTDSQSPEKKPDAVVAPEPSSGPTMPTTNVATATEPATSTPVSATTPGTTSLPPPKPTRPDGTPANLPANPTANIPPSNTPTNLPATNSPVTVSPTNTVLPTNTVSPLVAVRSAIPFAGDKLHNPASTLLTFVTTDHPNGCYAEGDLLKIRYQASEATHVYVIYHQTDKTALLMFPNRKQRSPLIDANQLATLPDEAQGVRIRIRPPFGPEVLQVVSSRQPITEFDKLIADEGGAPVVDAARWSRLAELLAKRSTDWAEQRLFIESFAKDKLPTTAPLGRAGLFIGSGQLARPELGAALPRPAAVARQLRQQWLDIAGGDRHRALLVTDAHATRAQLVRSFQSDLASFTHPGDTVLLYIAARVLTRPPISDAMTPRYVLLPYDALAGEANLPGEQRYAALEKSGVTDAELAEALAKLPGRHWVLAFDLISIDPPAEATQLAKQFFQPQLVALWAEKQEVSLLVGAISDESWADSLVADRLPLLATCWSEALQAAKPPLTWGDFFGAIQRQQWRLREDLAFQSLPELTVVPAAETAARPLLLTPGQKP